MYQPRRAGTNLAWYTEVFTNGPGATYDASIFDPSATSWTPGPLSPGKSYGFSLSAGSILGPVQVLATSPSGDSFTYAPSFETENEIAFTTATSVPALPTWGVPVLVLALLLVGSSVTRRRVRTS